MHRSGQHKVARVLSGLWMAHTPSCGSDVACSTFTWRVFRAIQHWQQTVWWHPQSN